MSGKPKSRSPKPAKRNSDDKSGLPMAQTATSTPVVADHIRDRQPTQVNFEFLNFSHPSEAKASGARRTVRSHVTRQQHQREQQAAAARKTKTSSQSSAEASSATRPSILPTQGTSSPGRMSPSGASPHHQTSSSEATSSVASTSGSPLQSPLRQPPVQIHPFDVYPVQWHSSIPVVVEHCKYYLSCTRRGTYMAACVRRTRGSTVDPCKFLFGISTTRFFNIEHQR